MKDLLRIADLSPDDLDHLLRFGDGVRRDPYLHRSLLRGDTVVLCFAKPSTRTRLSFASAVTRLGGAPQIVGPSELQLGRGETIEDGRSIVFDQAENRMHTAQALLRALLLDELVGAHEREGVR